ncbi:MAG: RpiB/LacA/LacB family sugar-phosphate isomerase [Nanoarchaeota archaeon]
MANHKRLVAEELRSHVIIAADHAGIGLKKYLVPKLVNAGYAVEDVGAVRIDPNDDYPDYAAKVARHVARDDTAVGVLICGTGAGMAMAANKIPFVRAAFCMDEFEAKMSREHNDANIITLRGRRFSKSKAWRVARIFLETPFYGEPRHVRRIKKIAKIEKARKKR